MLFRKWNLPEGVQQLSHCCCCCIQHLAESKMENNNKWKSEWDTQCYSYLGTLCSEFAYAAMLLIVSLALRKKITSDSVYVYLMLYKLLCIRSFIHKCLCDISGKVLITTGNKRPGTIPDLNAMLTINFIFVCYMLCTHAKYVQSTESVIFLWRTLTYFNTKLKVVGSSDKTVPLEKATW